jgi:hypothetical protein
MSTLTGIANDPFGPAVASLIAVLEEAKGRGKKFNEYSRNEIEDILGRLPARTQKHFLIVGAATQGYASDHYGSGAGKEFTRIARERLETEDIENLAAEWYINNHDRLEDDDDDYGFLWSKSRPLPRFLNEGERCAVLRRVMISAVDESVAYISAARELSNKDLSSVEIERFRAVWQGLPEKRREAIKIGLTYRWRDLENLLLYGLRNSPGLTVHLNGYPPSRLEVLLGYEPPTTIHGIGRPRWIDLELPFARRGLWATMLHAFSDFSREVVSLGGEREQVGSLLQRLMQSMRTHAAEIRGRMSIGRYIFKTKEENRWGPDFALVYQVKKDKELLMGRYVLFQAKLIVGGSVRISVGQLMDMLRSSWHSSFYIAWDSQTSPRCIAASTVRNLLRIARAGRPGSTANLKWTELGKFSDSLPDLLADRFFCGELGDPLPFEWGDNQSEVCRRLAELFGPPTHGIIAFTATVTSVRQDEGPPDERAEVLAEDITVWTEE